MIDNCRDEAVPAVPCAMSIKTVFFDIDDTIYDRSLPFINAMKDCFGSAPENAYEVYLACNRRGNEVFLPSQRGEISMEEMYIYRYCKGFGDMGLELSPERAMEFQRHYRRNQSRITMSAEMEAVLDFAREKFEKIGIITNGPSDKQRGKIAALGLDMWFRPELIIVSGEVGLDKPDPEIFRLAQNLCGCRGRDILYIGDSLTNDMIPAALVGWNTLWYNRRGAVRAEGISEPDFNCGNEAGVLDILRRLADKN